MHEEVVRILSIHDLRNTTPRRIVFEALLTHGAPASIIELVQLCPSIDKVSVYRTIELFSKLGITNIVTHGWKQRYELAAPFKPHHHHLVCRACGTASEIHSPGVEKLIASIASEQSFVPSDHVFEINGLCRTCNTTKP
jgi:Fe2+ or Zn2+ uptake regulation protein